MYYGKNILLFFYSASLKPVIAYTLGYYCLL